MGAAPTLTFAEKKPEKAPGASARARKRATVLVAAATALLGIGSVPMAVEMIAGPGSGFPGTGAARTFLDMLNYRSPGERTEARLNEKNRRPLVTDVLSERDAAPELIPPALTLTAPELAMPVIPVEAPLFALAIPPGPGFAPPGLSIVPPGFTPPGPPGFVPPGITPPGPPGPPPPPPPPPPVVPEPAAWMSMLLGFGILGSTMRRRASRQAALGRG